MHATAHIAHDTRRTEPSRLWARAARLLAILIMLAGSPADLIRNAHTTRRERREIGFMLAPVEALVRALLFSAAITWLVCTEEGARVLHEARRNAARPASRSAPVSASKPASTRAAASAAPAGDPCTDRQDDQAAGTGAPSAADIAGWLAPARLRFEPCETAPWGREVRPARGAAPSRPRRSIRRPPPNLRHARRIAALARIIADPHAAMVDLAHDLARRELGLLYVPTPRNWIDEHWTTIHADIRAARARSFPNFCWFESHRRRLDTLALPPPEPG